MRLLIALPFLLPAWLLLAIGKLLLGNRTVAPAAQAIRQDTAAARTGNPRRSRAERRRSSKLLVSHLTRLG